MATTTQPISLGGHGRRDHRASQDVNMTSGSYTSAEGGSFNPASYTRHFLGSPMSFRSVTGSYNSRLGSMMGYPGSVGSVTMGSPMDVHRDPALSSALKIFEFQDELCRNYTCCGIHLTDLHALLEHFEDVHVVFVNQPTGGAPQTRISVPFEPQVLDAGGVPQPLHPNQQQQQIQQHNSMQQGGGPVDPDDMEMEMPPPSSTASAASSMPSSPTSTPSPPETLLATPLSAYSSPSGLVHSSLAAAYPGGYPGIGTQKSSAPPSPPQTSVNAVGAPPVSNQELQNINNHGGQNSNQRPNLAVNVSGFSSALAASRASHSPFITGPPPSGGGAWIHGHGTPGGVDMTYMGNIGMNGGNIGMGGFGGNFDYQNAYGYSFPQGAGAESNMGSEAGAIDMGCVQPALLFSNPSSPQSHQSDGANDGLDDEDADAEFDIDIEEHETGKPAASHQIEAKEAQEVKKEKGASKLAPKGSKNKTVSASAAGDVTALGVSSAPIASASSSVSTNATKPAPRIGRPPTTGGSGLLQSKPFKCPKPNCNKSYKQANGLKYHITHGSCNFAPPKDLEHVQAILDRKRKAQQQQQQQQQEDSSHIASSASAVSSGANTPRSGMATPTTPSSINSPFNTALNLNIGAASAAGSTASSALSSPVGTSSGSQFTGGGASSTFTPTPSSLSSALSQALSLSSPTAASSGYTEGSYQDSGEGASSSSSPSRSNSYGHPSVSSNVSGSGTTGASSSASSSSLINALTPLPSTSTSTTSSNAPASPNTNNANSLTSLRSTLSSLPPSELLAIEAEAERQLKPYACGVGDCPRRYKNMNGLRYHYQHSGDHGAIGLQWLASGKHECLSQRGDKSAGKGKSLGAAAAAPGAGTAYPVTARAGGAEREGRKVRGAAGTSSKPTSRASSVSANTSRTGTPVNATFPPLPFSTGVAGEMPQYQQPQQYSHPSAAQSPQVSPQAQALQYQQTQQFSPQPTNANHPNHPNYQSHLGYSAQGV